MATSPGSEGPTAPGRDGVPGTARRAGRSAPTASDTGDGGDLESTRIWQGFRLPPTVLARAKSRAEQEDVTLTSIVEDLLQRYGSGEPRDPEVVKRRLRNKGIRSTRRTRPQS